MDIKDWILIGGGALLAAVIGHGFWLAWRSRRDPLKMDLDPNIPSEEVDELFLLRGELPNGGARVIGPASDEKPQAQQTLDLSDSAVVAGAGVREHASAGARHQARPRATPTLVTENRTGVRQSEPTGDSARASASSASSAAATGAVASGAATPSPAPRADVSRPSAAASGAPPRKSILDRPKPKLAPRNRGETTAAKAVERERPAAPPVAPGPDEIIVVHVLARGNARFGGTALMNTFLRNTLKFGDMNIFHRIDPVSKQARFSVASAVEPGTFDLAKMDAFSTAGVTFFLRLPGPPDPLATFEDMLGVARDVATSLAGDLKDDQRSVLTAQTIEHCRQRISEFSRKRMSQRG
jgi:cell division protein ZipA